MADRSGRRGAGGSKGRTSWTGKAEVADYQSVVGCFVQYLHLLEGGPGNSPRGSNALGSHPFQLILGGYSYGSMIATRLPDLPTIHTVFSAPKHGTAAAEIILRAEHLAAQTNDEMRTMAHSNPQRAGPRQSLDHTLVVGGDESIDHSRRSRDIRRSHDIRGSLDLVSQRISSGLSKKSPPKAADNDANEKPESTSATSFPGFTAQAYLLVSPLLPPISSLAALPVSRSSNSEDQLAKFRSHPTLAIFGSKDAFTSAKKLRVWASDLQNANPRFRFAEIDGAGHFWHGEDDVKQLIGQLDEWIQELVKDG
jgi:pimeloyl-ACP methyl ester carboxylesterase